MSTSPTAKHVYTVPGTYTVALTVTDNNGAKNTLALRVTVAPPPVANKPPVASFTAELVSPTSSTVSFNGAASYDPDGQIAAFDIDWGDGSPHGVQSSTTHTYAKVGTYTITLTVTDNEGATGTAQRSVIVIGSGHPPPPPGGYQPNPVKGVPTYDHIVYVWMENHSSTGIYGNTAAPYINSLAAGGAKFVNAKAEAHPSEPNYLAGFSGSTQNVTDDGNYDLSGDNLYTQLITYGLTFTAYSEDLPSIGYTGTTSGGYARKHAPWVSFQAKGYFDGSHHLPFSSFPSNYASLPKVSWVVPNLNDDEHDGSIAQSDSWLQNKLGGLFTWAKSNNSLVILVWDEDDSGSANGNDIPLILYGAHLAPGTYSETVDHYDLLGLIQDVCGVPRLNKSSGLPIFTYPFDTAIFTETDTGLVANFDASRSTDTGTITTFAWDFGDGSTGSGVKTSHTYKASGNYKVTLKTTDSNGFNATATQTISVSANPPGQSGFYGNATTSTGTPTAHQTLTFAKAVVTAAGTGTATAPSPPVYFMGDGNLIKHVQLKPTSSHSVMQASIYVPQSTYTYMAQAHNGSNGSPSPYNSTSFTRFGEDGVERDYMYLKDANHPWSYGIEYTSGTTYIWTSWQRPRSGGKQWDLVRFPWDVGGGSYDRSNPPAHMTIPYPGGLDGGNSESLVSFEPGSTHATVRVGSDGYFRRYKIADFLAGRATKANAINAIKPHFGAWTLQGFASQGESLFVYSGVAHDGNTPPASDPPMINEYAWKDGSLLNTYSTAALGKVNGVYPGNPPHYEPEGLSIYRNSASNTPDWLYIGVCTNNSGYYNYDLYTLSLPTTNKIKSYVWNWGDGTTTSGAKASHTYAANGAYTITLTVTDAVGRTGWMKQPIYIVK